MGKGLTTKSAESVAATAMNSVMVGVTWTKLMGHAVGKHKPRMAQRIHK